MVGVPSLENTAPKKLDAATRKRISTEISRVLTRASWNFDGVIFLYASVISSAPRCTAGGPLGRSRSSEQDRTECKRHFQGGGHQTQVELGPHLDPVEA